MVESRTSTESEKLFYLSKFTAGQAHESIKGFLSLYSDPTSYRKARNVIVSRYGNRLKIAEAFKQRLCKWPVVKDGDGEALQAFADFLWQCHSAMGSLDYLSNLSCQEENRKLAAKLPKTVGERWDRIVDDAVFGEEPDLTSEPSGLVGRFPTFHEFCQFVSKEGRILVGTCTKPQQPAAPSTNKRKATSFKVEAKETKPAATAKPAAAPRQGPASARCDYCEGSHPLYQCNDFLQRAVEFKKAYAIERRLCFGCLKDNHTFRTCRIRNPEIMRDHVEKPEQPKNSATSLHVNAGGDEGEMSSLIVAVWAYNDENPEFRVLTYALLDTQSIGCFMSEELADRLQLEPLQVNLELTTLGSRRCVRSGLATGIRVKGEHGTESIALPKCYTRREIPGSHKLIPRPEQVAAWPHLRDVSKQLSPPREDINFGLLIGFNCGEALCAEEYRRGEDRQHPFAMRTVLGWAVSGRLDRKPRVAAQSCWSFHTRVKEATVDDVKRAFDQGFESATASDRKLSQDDAAFIDQMQKGMRLMDDSHFEIPLPFKQEPTDLPDSRPMAFKRLMSVKRKMLRDPVFGASYSGFMNGLIETGQATLVDSNDVVPIGQRWYWCHHAVVHPRKPNKMRGVWDGAAEVSGVSINSRLLSGPDQMNNLAGVLLRFRQEKVAVTCDIEGMFLQVRVAPRHQQYLRFLWFANGDPREEIQEYQMTVLPFGATSSPACAGSVLKETADRFEGKFGSRAAQFVRENFYMDDGLGSEQDDEHAVELIKNSRSLCAAGGFNLRKFASSSRAVMDSVPREWLVDSLKELRIRQDKLPNERVLGLLMSMEQDEFLYSVCLTVRDDTRRGYLSALSSLFDPLGLVSPALLPGRLLLQQLCSDKFTWDQSVDDDVREQWDKWYQRLLQLERLAVTRCYRRTVELPLAGAELHTFTDASSHGYGACCYLRLTDDRGHCDTTLVYAKSRVAPAKRTTITRLELQAAVLGVKMGQFVAEELRYDGLVCRYWTDSMVVLGYVTNEARRFHVYVANRSQFIRDHTSLEQWGHVATDRNPADMASRGVGSAELVDSELWWRGPGDVMARPSVETGIVPLEEEDPELRREAVAMVVETHEEPGAGVKLLNRLSSWRKCVRVAARCIQFAEMCRRLPERSVVELDSAAERWLVREVQTTVFAEEIGALQPQTYTEGREEVRDRKARLRMSSNLYRLSVYLDTQGVLRVGGRLRLSGWPRDQVHPVVLPARHVLTDRVISYYHAQVGHMGTVTTLNKLRQAGFWIVGGRSSVSRVVLSCVHCRRQRGRPVEQRMADLPADRVETGPPFTHAAVDVFGPILVKRGRTVEKWWVCVFVCMASRAVHLEPISSLDISGFMQAYRRFVARRGPVRTLRCDRGTNFVGADNAQRNAFAEIGEEQLTDELGRRSCDLIPFRFNYPKSSHMAGAWERMIRTIRSAYWMTISRHGESLYLDVFLTLLAEAESLVNSRPITVVDMQDDTTPNALTPSQLLTLKPEVVAPPPGVFGPEERYAARRWRITQHLAQQFWRRWIREYAYSQQKRQKWNEARDNMKIGDIVVLCEENSPRAVWPMGRIVDVVVEEDNLVRKVTVQTRTSLLKRPVQKVILLYRPKTSEVDDRTT